MKKSAFILGFTVIVSSMSIHNAEAAVLSCADLNRAYEADEITELKNVLGGSARLRLERLKATIAYFVDGKVEEGTLAELTRKYQAFFTHYQIGRTHLEGVNIDLGDNGFEQLFVQGSSDPAGIHISDGDLTVDGKSCTEKVALEPALTEARRRALCVKAVQQVKRRLPQTTYDVRACMTHENRKSPEILVTDHSEATIQWSVGRNLADYNGSYFGCNATMNRETDEVTRMSCSVGK